MKKLTTIIGALALITTSVMAMPDKDYTFGIVNYTYAAIYKDKNWQNIINGPKVLNNGGTMTTYSGAIKGFCDGFAKNMAPINLSRVNSTKTAKHEEVLSPIDFCYQVSKGYSYSSARLGGKDVYQGTEFGINSLIYMVAHLYANENPKLLSKSKNGLILDISKDETSFWFEVYFKAMKPIQITQHIFNGGEWNGHKQAMVEKLLLLKRLGNSKTPDSKNALKLINRIYKNDQSISIKMKEGIFSTSEVSKKIISDFKLNRKRGK